MAARKKLTNRTRYVANAGAVPPRGAPPKNGPTRGMPRELRPTAGGGSRPVRCTSRIHPFIAEAKKPCDGGRSRNTSSEDVGISMTRRDLQAAFASSSSNGMFRAVVIDFERSFGYAATSGYPHARCELPPVVEITKNNADAKTSDDLASVLMPIKQVSPLRRGKLRHFLKSQFDHAARSWAHLGMGFRATTWSFGPDPSTAGTEPLSGDFPPPDGDPANVSRVVDVSKCPAQQVDGRLAPKLWHSHSRWKGR
ncbi:hypothetical protein CKAH01_11770 [Colletotrichum kahawae]|uniref:Uncharacterized protein n=1 Tax=Colletotrichum kahawae TaxID=34407 RepID=A0AAE0DG45_COLKA|nr:hypothetical protein CKAH01_11770 [Colletotrichum kahawae]